MANEAQSRTYRVPTRALGDVEVAAMERGSGENSYLLLHGGAGPASMARFAGILAGRADTRVITPTHPGFALTKRPDGLRTVKGLAELYGALIDQLGLRGVTVVGNSLGGWIAAEMALVPGSGIGRVVLVGALGIEVQGYSIPDTSKMSLDELMSLSYHNAGPFRIDLSKLTEAQRAVGASNRAALNLYAPTMADPTLAGRLAKASVPVLVISGESDRIVTPEYGRGYAAAIPGARFQVLKGTGHVPQIETPELLLEAILSFKAGSSTRTGP